ncbi:hypothetical protein DDT52_02340 [Brenneria roseae subsp. roseae]|nr:hypothetical protein DDT52_02340 [Brenneria roseae subsp. roseae]
MIPGKRLIVITNKKFFNCSIILSALGMFILRLKLVMNYFISQIADISGGYENNKLNFYESFR